MKTAELTGKALDWAVSKAEGFDYFGEFLYAPSQLWEQGGLIIESEEMTIEHTVDVNKTYWKAWCWIDGEDAQAYGYGKTPLIAAMRCYVASKLGEEVQIPDGLN
jgi:hypothetical protein